MTTIITGNFQQQDEAQHALSDLAGAGFAAASAQQDAAIRILRARGATDIERTEGTIVAGDWTDFNPLKLLRLVAA